MKQSAGAASTDKGKEKVKASESAPLTRQGYRSGQLADDFWTALGVPNIPQAHRKRLKVIPFLINHKEEYLVDTKAKPSCMITVVQIAELLAGIPWTTNRARQHVVNEVAQALHRILIFNNTTTSPFQKWTQGSWYAQWSHMEGEHTCTLYVHIIVPEYKIKIRKGRELYWRNIPSSLLPIPSPQEEIQDGQEMDMYWHAMMQTQGQASQPPPTVTTPNPYEALNQEEANAS